MPTGRVPIKNPKAELDVGIGSIQIKLANGVTDIRGLGDVSVLPPGQLSVYLTPYQWYSDGSFNKALPQEVIPDVAAWIGRLDPKYAARAAATFAALGDGLLWFQALYMALAHPDRYDLPDAG